MLKLNKKKLRPIEKNLCEIQWNKNENTELADIVNLHADDLQNRFHSKESEKKNVFCIQLGPLILFNVERDSCVKLAVIRGNNLLRCWGDKKRLMEVF